MRQTLLNLHSKLDLFQTLAKTVNRELKKRGIGSVGEYDANGRLGLQLEFDADIKRPIVFSHCLGGEWFADVENCKTVLLEAIWAADIFESKGITLKNEDTLLDALLFGGKNNGLRLEFQVYLDREEPHVTLELTESDQEWLKIFINPHSCVVDGIFPPNSQLESLCNSMVRPDDKGQDLPKRCLNKMLEKMADFYLTRRVPVSIKRRGAKKS